MNRRLSKWKYLTTWSVLCIGVLLNSGCENGSSNSSSSGGYDGKWVGTTRGNGPYDRYRQGSISLTVDGKNVAIDITAYGSATYGYGYNYSDAQQIVPYTRHFTASISGASFSTVGIMGTFDSDNSCVGSYGLAGGHVTGTWTAQK